MPAPARTSRDAIVAAAREILEEDGLDAVVMSRVAERVGVRGPSLYKHVRDRATLIGAVADMVIDELGDALGDALALAASTGKPRAGLIAATRAYRAFVHANPNAYGLLFTPGASDLQVDPARLAALGEPLVIATERLVGDERALTAARTIVAWAHGFVSMELAGAFRLGGDLDEAYADGIASILVGVSGRGRRKAASRRTG